MTDFLYVTSIKADTVEDAIKNANALLDKIFNGSSLKTPKIVLFSAAIKAVASDPICVYFKGQEHVFAVEYANECKIEIKNDPDNVCVFVAVKKCSSSLADTRPEYIFRS